MPQCKEKLDAENFPQFHYCTVEGEHEVHKCRCGKEWPDNERIEIRYNGQTICLYENWESLTLKLDGNRTLSWDKEQMKNFAEAN